MSALASRKSTLFLRAQGDASKFVDVIMPTAVALAL
jgi:hypothetical protein